MRITATHALCRHIPLLSSNSSTSELFWWNPHSNHPNPSPKCSHCFIQVCFILISSLPFSINYFMIVLFVSFVWILSVLLFSMGRKYFHEKFFPRKFKVIKFPQPCLVIYPCFFPNLLRQAWKLLLLSCAPYDGFWSQNKRRNDEFQIIHILKWENIQKRICCVERDCLRNSGLGNYFISVWFRIPVWQIQDSGLALGSKWFGVSTQKHPKLNYLTNLGCGSCSFVGYLWMIMELLNCIT